MVGPLWEISGLKGITISLVGDTGAGKSIAQLMIQSVYGNPGKLHFSAKATHNAMFNRLGTYGNLPMTIDEATYMQDVGDFCYTVTEGRDKARLSRTATEREAKEWATNVIVSTNISFASKLTSSGIELDAQLARLLEVHMPVKKLFAENSTAGRTIVEHLANNHGIPGHIYIQELLKIGEAGIRHLLKKAVADFASLYGVTFLGSERYWETELAAQHVGGTIAEAAGLIKYDFRKGIQLKANGIVHMRNKIADSHVEWYDLVKEYLNDVAADALTIMHTQGQHAAIDQMRIPRGVVKAQFDVHRKEANGKFEIGTVMIVRKHFREWLAGNGYDYTRLCADIKSAGADATPRLKKCVLGKGTAIKVGQQYVVGINLKHNDMIGYLDDIQTTADNLTLGKLNLV